MFFFFYKINAFIRTGCERVAKYVFDPIKNIPFSYDKKTYGRKEKKTGSCALLAVIENRSATFKFSVSAGIFFIILFECYANTE